MHNEDMKTTDITIRKSSERGHADHGWLKAKHSFSFARYYDPAHMGFRSLRVINEDQIAPGQGFGTHPHDNMEIFTYVVSGELEHKDSMGNGRVIKAGEFQYMSAGSGVTHSEFNPNAAEPTHLLQIWIEPSERGGEPRYGDLDTNQLKESNGLTLFASADGRDGSFAMRQDAEISVGRLEANTELTLEPTPDYGYWIQVIHGELNLGSLDNLGDLTAETGDGIRIDSLESPLTIAATQDSELLVFKLS